MKSPFKADLDEAVTANISSFVRRADSAVAAIGHMPEALHDFRVALRHIRSWLKAFGADTGIEPELTRAVANLASATNRCRDLEVYVAWLDQQLANPPSRPLQSYSSDIRKNLRQESKSAEAVIIAGWPGLRQELLEEISADSKTTERFVRISFIALTARMDRLNSQLLGVVDNQQEELLERELHRFRINIKQIHYLLDVFKPWESHCRKGVREIKSLQDELGLYHDLCIFSATLLNASASNPELTPLTKSAVDQGHTQFHKLQRHYFTPPMKWLKHLDQAIQAIEKRVKH